MVYTSRNFEFDVRQICTKHYVKAYLLRDLISNKITDKDFINQLSKISSENYQYFDTNQIITEVSKIRQKIALNNGKIDEDIVTKVKRLKKAGEVDQAFGILLPYIKKNKNDTEANLTFGWIMYDILKKLETNPKKYVERLKELNDLVTFNFKRIQNNDMKIYLDTMLWSIRRVVKQGEGQANFIFPEFKRFVGEGDDFIENRMIASDQYSASRLLIVDLMKNLSETNYYLLMEMIGFEWFDNFDHQSKTVDNDNKSMGRPQTLADKILTYHAKKLSVSNNNLRLAQTEKFIDILSITISDHPEYEWLPYNKLKLLIKIGKIQEAFIEGTTFARTKSQEFWVWDTLSELTSGDDKFNCLCASILCKSPDEMIVKVQMKIIPYLLDRNFYPEAKYVLDKLIDVRLQKRWRVDSSILDLRKEGWYKVTTPASNLNELIIYADKAKALIYQTLPFTNVIISYINNEKGVINFNYYETTDLGENLREGYFYVDSIDQAFEFKLYQELSIKILEDKKRKNLFKIFEIEKTNPEIKSKFIHHFNGVFEKVKEFGFIRDSFAEIFVNPSVVKEYKISPYATVTGRVIEKHDKKRYRKTWQIVGIDSIIEPNMDEFEKEVTGEISLSLKGFGFLDDVFVPASLLLGNNIEEYDTVVAKASKSWDQKRDTWSWKAIEILSSTNKKHAQEKEYREYLQSIE